MKLLYLHRTQGRGVERVHIDGICRGLAARGFEITEIAPSHRPPATASPPGRPGLGARISRHAPEWVFELIEMAYNLVAVYRALRHGGRPTLVYERYAIFSLAGLLVSRLRRCPLVIECNYTALNPLFRQRTRLFLPIARWVDRRVLSRAEVIVCVSSTIKAQIAERYGIAGDQVIVQPNASELQPPADPPACEIAGFAPDHRVIGFVGGFYPWHGLPLLARAFLKTLEAVPGARLLLIGEGPERATIEGLLRDHGALDKAVFTGQLPHRELPGYLQRFDVGVMPDSNDYGSPMKIFEYMALGVPVVAPDYPPIREVFDGQGICFARGDVDSFAAALTRLLADPELNRRQGQRGQALIRSRHNWQANADQTLAALDRRGHRFCLSRG